MAIPSPKEDTEDAENKKIEEDMEQDPEPNTETTKKPGIVYMFLQQEFQGYHSRRKADIQSDARNIRTCFKKLGFHVKKRYVDLTADEIKHCITEARDSNILMEYECLVVFVVTRSPASGQLLCKDGILFDEEIIHIMKGDTFTYLPKLFVFQAPQATTDDPDMEIDDDAAPFDGRSQCYPPEANFFVIKSSFEREVSEDGSFFLKAFCKFMENIGNESLFNAVVEFLGEMKANRNLPMLQDLTTDNPERSRNNILPEVTSTLLKPMFFCHGGTSTLNLSRYDEKGSFGKLTVFNYAYTSRTLNSAIKLRRGTEYDVAAIKKNFPNIGFEVEVMENKTAKTVLKKLAKGRKYTGRDGADAPTDYSNDTCVAVAIMTHGRTDRFSTTSGYMDIVDVLINLTSTKKEIQREDLSGKPKIFFLQVCRGNNRVDPSEPQINLPLEIDDILVFHSTYHGKKSKRNRSRGTWFIQELCKKIDAIEVGKSASLTDISQEVQNAFVHKYGPTQMPVMYSTLTKQLFIEKHRM